MLMVSISSTVATPTPQHTADFFIAQPLCNQFEDFNLARAERHAGQMLGQFGRIEYAAAAYNAGPGRAQRWLAERGGLDIEEWIETIPFTETRGYVQGVLRYAANYRRFYKE